MVFYSRRNLLLAAAAGLLLVLVLPSAAHAGEKVVILAKRGQVGEPGPHGGDYRKVGTRRLECVLSPGKKKIQLFLADAADKPLKLDGTGSAFYLGRGKGVIKLKPATGGIGKDPWAEVSRLEGDCAGKTLPGRLVLHVFTGGVRYDIAYDGPQLPVAEYGGAAEPDEPEATEEPEEPEATEEPDEPEATEEPEETAEPEATEEPEETVEPEATDGLEVHEARDVPKQPHQGFTNVGRMKAKSDQAPQHGGEVRAFGPVIMELAATPAKDAFRIYVWDRQGKPRNTDKIFAEIFMKGKGKLVFKSRGAYLESKTDVRKTVGVPKLVLHITVDGKRFDMAFKYPPNYGSGGGKGK